VVEIFVILGQLEVRLLPLSREQKSSFVSIDDALSMALLALNHHLRGELQLLS
jgi:hypothetical protein